jgi:hypothetical protein
MMNQQQEIMVLSIGLGVGVAAVLGTLKFLYDLSLKMMIAACLVPTIAGACYMHWCVCLCFWGDSSIRCVWRCFYLLRSQTRMPHSVALCSPVSRAPRAAAAAAAATQGQPQPPAPAGRRLGRRRRHHGPRHRPRAAVPGRRRDEGAEAEEADDGRLDGVGRGAQRG